MTAAIDQILAQQIVDTVHDVCGRNINFIDSSGTILASTDESRIGTYHEIGYRIARTGEAAEVGKDQLYPGTQEGINLPVYHNRKVVAVIGITGDPEEVRQYASLAVKITQIFIREKELESTARTNEEKRHYIIRSLIGEEEDLNNAYLKECLREFGVREETKKRIVIIRMMTDPDAARRMQQEARIEDLLRQLPVQVSSFAYPGSYIVLFEEEGFSESAAVLERFAGEQRREVQIGAGKACSLYALKESYQTGLIALKDCEESGRPFVSFDDLALEVILDGVKKTDKEEFKKKILRGLEPEDLRILYAYFGTGMSLKKTGEQLFLHKNTLQYKLNHIAGVCGYDPRKFQDGVLLYLALRMLP